jgi:ribonuclease BN (tRNA processing enzyme)
VIHTLSIPTPFAVGRVNCYLIDDDPLTLVDTGPNSGKALDELDVALRAHGRRIDDLERIVITHQHLDHMGLVGILARRSQAEVVTLDLLAPVIEEFGAYAERDDELAESLMLRHGIPRDVVIALRSMSRAFRAWAAARRSTGGSPTARRSSSPAARCRRCTGPATRRRTRCSGTPNGGR